MRVGKRKVKFMEEERQGVVEGGKESRYGGIGIGVQGVRVGHANHQHHGLPSHTFTVPKNSDGSTPTSIPCCPACHFVLQLYKIRNSVLVFKSESTASYLEMLKGKSAEMWTDQEIEAVIDVYKTNRLSSKKAQQRSSSVTKRLCGQTNDFLKDMTIDLKLDNSRNSGGLQPYIAKIEELRSQYWKS